MKAWARRWACRLAYAATCVAGVAALCVVFVFMMLTLEWWFGHFHP